jgi:hypothetical protein
MKKRVLVWGTGNVGRPAIRAVLSHHDLELAGVVVANPAKLGRDAGEDRRRREDRRARQPRRPRPARAGRGRGRLHRERRYPPRGGLQDLLACLRAGANVVSTSFYALLYPPTTPPQLREQVESACREGDSSVFVSGIDPGWALDILPVLLSGVVADSREVRCQEIFNYAFYDQPDVVRHVIGFGGSMDELPLMLHEFSLKMVWEPMVRLLGDGLGHPVDAVEASSSGARSPDPGRRHGAVREGTQGAFRFEVRGLRQGKALYVVERRPHRRRLPRLAPSARGTRLSSRPDPRQSGPARQHPRRGRLRAGPPAAATPPPQIASSTASWPSATRSPAC